MVCLYQRAAAYDYCLPRRLLHGEEREEVEIKKRENRNKRYSKVNRIKVVLAEQEKTSKWLAEQVGKSAYTVSKWCSNKTQPDLQTLEEIARVLGIDKRDLLTPTIQSKI